LDFLVGKGWDIEGGGAVDEEEGISERMIDEDGISEMID
jgi:hypothetical protein